MTKTATVNDLVANLISGRDVQTAWRRLGKRGRPGVDAILNAMDGGHVPAPEDRHLREIQEDLIAGLQAIARVNPLPLITALRSRPRHTFCLVWALGSSRAEPAAQKLIDYAKHKDPLVRWAAVMGLARLRRKSVLQPLLDALRDRSSEVRFAALEGLVKVANHSAIVPLKRYLGDKRLQPGVRRIVNELVDKLEKGG